MGGGGGVGLGVGEGVGAGVAVADLGEVLGRAARGDAAIMAVSLTLPGMSGPSLWKPPVQRAKRVPRYYQQDAFVSTMKNLAEYRSTLLVGATGTGKTFTASMPIKVWPGKVLWLNERDNLVSQVRGELADLLGEEVYIEQGDIRAPEHARVVVGSLQSLAQPKRLAKISVDRFSLIVPDEAHHSLARSYLRIFEHFKDAKIMGLTATPDRLDGKAMGLVYDSQSMDYQMFQAIQDGYLVRPVLRFAKRIDVSKIKARGEFSDDQIAGTMGDDVLKGMCEDIIREAPGLKGVIYWPRVDIAHVAAGLLNSMLPGCASAVDGEQDRDLKRSILRSHLAGNFPYLCNVGVVEEGHDDPGIMFVGHGRPTKSRAKCTQWTGRGGRPLCKVDLFATPDERRAAIAVSPKPTLLVLDFVGNHGTHELVSVVDALAGRHVTEAVKTRAKRILDGDGGGDVEQAIATAQRLDDQDRREEVARVARVEAAKFEWKTIDPFTAFGMPGQTDVATALTRASLKQRALLVRSGVEVKDSLTADDAQRLIRSVKARERAGLASYGQIKILSRHGIPAQRMYAGTARRIMDAIARNRGWTPPPEVIEAIIKRGRKPGEDDRS